MTTPQTKLPKVGTTIFTVMSQLAAEHGAVNLGQGFPDFDVPTRLIQALDRAMREGRNQYAPMTGIPALRQAIAAKTDRCYGHKPDPDTEVTVTSGASEAIFDAVAAVVEESPPEELGEPEAVGLSVDPLVQEYLSKIIFAKLLTPKIDLPERADGSTLNLDWWLYEEAIVIDTAGRYAVPENEKRDRVEWKSFLKTLARHKQKEPLSGLVLVISAERLLGNNDDDLLDEGRHIRASLTDLMKNLEAKPPVYLMVTKCDLIPGCKDWCEYIPVESLRQPMGYLNEDEGGTLDETIDAALNSVLGRMKELRLLMLERSHNAGDSLLTLPVEMEKVRSGLHTFANTSLKENVYQETPRFRGLFFSSGVLDFDADTTSQGNSLGGFLHHFYTRILPSDRGMTDNLAASVRIRLHRLEML